MLKVYGSKRMEDFWGEKNTWNCECEFEVYKEGVHLIYFV